MIKLRGLEQAIKSRIKRAAMRAVDEGTEDVVRLQPSRIERGNRIAELAREGRWAEALLPNAASRTRITP